MIGMSGRHLDVDVRSLSAAQLKELAYAARREAKAAEEGSGRARKALFAAFCALEITANFDAGVLPATIAHVMAEFELSFADAGALGAVVYLGLVVASPLAGFFLTNLSSQKRLLRAAAAANALAVLSFALAPDARWLFAGRALIGATQAPIIIYAPVWVDEFAPAGSGTMWMSVLQATVALGIMAGYVTAGVIVTHGEEICTTSAVVRSKNSFSASSSKPNHTRTSQDVTHGGHQGCYSPGWRVPLYLQAAGMAVFAPFFASIDARHLDCRGGCEQLPAR